MRYETATLKTLPQELKDILSSNLIQKTEDGSDGDIPNAHDGTFFNKGLFLFGATGRGKTYALYAIKNTLTLCGSYNQVYSWQEVLHDIKGSFDKHAISPIEELKSAKVLIIDDLGVEKDTEWSQEILYMIINKAYVNETPVFISTNLSIAEFGEKYGDRIMARLEEMCDFHELKGEDRRINNG